MQAYVSNKITIEDASEEVLLWCKQNLEFPNPEYSKKQSLGIWVGNIQPTIVLWEKRGKDVILPYGTKELFFRNFPVKIVMDSCLLREKFSEQIEYKSHIEPFDYQEKCLQGISGSSNGVIVMPCGSGKTQTALELIARIGKKTLWLTHTQELLKQSMERAKSCYDLSEDQYGTITAGKVQVGQALTFATVQTMSNIDLEPYKDYWDVIIVDECHKAVGTPTKLMMFYKVVSSLSARYKFGLTATPDRNDGLQRCMYALLGEKLYEVQKEEVKKNTVPIRVWQYRSTVYNPENACILRPDGTLDFTKLINNLCSDINRNSDIARLVNSMNSLGKSCLVLSDRVEHLEILRETVGKDNTLQIYSMSGSKAAKQARKDCIEKLKKKEIRCLFATYQLAKEGLDIPSLDCVVFATPKKDRITIVQSCGRAGRAFPGKDFGYVIDYVDESMPILKGYSRGRRSIYKTEGYEVY